MDDIVKKTIERAEKALADLDNIKLVAIITPKNSLYPHVELMKWLEEQKTLGIIHDYGFYLTSEGNKILIKYVSGETDPIIASIQKITGNAKVEIGRE